MTWTPFTDARPPEAGLFWFRLLPASYGGVACRPEWVGEVSLCGDGGDRRNPWPNMSHWNGYERTVPAGLEWRAFSDMDKVAGLRNGDHVIPGLTIWPCPHCGTPASLECDDRPEGGGARLYTAPFRPNLFKITCRVCWIGTRQYRDLKALLDSWNRRTPFHPPSDTHACCGYKVGEGHNGTCAAYGQDEGISP